ncbi:Protein of unknown function [Bacillus cereus]|nr:Protein of unknown function [Bacillus cereus]SCN33428.1 Protein of unknown function [Bacillus wiedmannii]
MIKIVSESRLEAVRAVTI